MRTLTIYNGYGDETLKHLKSSQVKMFKASRIGCEGCTVGNRDTNKIFRYLTSIEELSLHDSPCFIVPCAFPKGLKKLELFGVKFTSPSLAGLPLGLLELKVILVVSKMPTLLNLISLIYLQPTLIFYQKGWLGLAIPVK